MKPFRESRPDQTRPRKNGASIMYTLKGKRNNWSSQYFAQSTLGLVGTIITREELFSWDRERAVWKNILPTAQRGKLRRLCCFAAVYSCACRCVLQLNEIEVSLQLCITCHCSLPSTTALLLELFCKITSLLLLVLKLPF